MDILMITHFCVLPWEKGNGRFHYIANMLAARGHTVENVTSSFSHDAKQQRDIAKVETESASLPYKVTLINEPSYSKNVSLKRIKSHKKFAKNLSAYLERRAKPDVVYCTVPSLAASSVASEYCKKHGVRFVIDIQDLWPEAFQMVFNIPVISSTLFSPMRKKANAVYSSADGIIAVSQTYADRAKSVNDKCDKAYVVYLGTDKDHFDACAGAAAPVDREGTLRDFTNALSADISGFKKTRMAYIGTLGSSYDLDTVFAAMKKLDKSVLDKIEFIIMGDGPKRAEFEAEAKDLPVIFTGNLEYRDMVWLLSRCDIAVNPIVRGAAQSVINKHMDYAMAGLPVISTQENEEYRSLIDKYNSGINCGCENADDVADAIMTLTEDGEKAAELGKGSRQMGVELFDRHFAYKQIEDVICNGSEENL